MIQRIMKHLRGALSTGLLLWLPAIVTAGDYDHYYQNLPIELERVTAPVIPDRELSLADVGGVGDGVTLNTEAFRKGISRLQKQGGGRLTVPQGVWLTGPIKLKDNIELHLDKNAIIYFSPDKRLYVEEGKEDARVLACISASKRKNVAITGEGIIDGNGQQWRPVKRGKVSDVEWSQFRQLGGVEQKNGSLWYPWQRKSGYPDIAGDPVAQERMRNDLVRFTDCENVLFQGVTFQNSPRFHVHPCFSKNVIVDGITVRCPWNAQNGDAIDLSDCHRALIVNSVVDAGDDGLCMKSGKPKSGHIAGCSDILIACNTVYHAHGGFVIGSEEASGIHRLVVRNNRFSGTDTGLRFKSAMGRGGETADIYISDIVMTDIKDEAIVFQCDYVDRPAGTADDYVPTYTEEQRRWAPNFQRIHISGITCRGARTGIRAAGMRGLSCVKDITIENSTIVYTKTATQIDEQTAQLTLRNVTLLKDECKE